MKFSRNALILAPSTERDETEKVVVVAATKAVPQSHCALGVRYLSLASRYCLEKASLFFPFRNGRSAQD